MSAMNQPTLFEQPKFGTPAHLREWLAEHRIPECDCGYGMADSPYEAHWLTGGLRECDAYPGYVLTTVAAECQHHGSRQP